MTLPFIIWASDLRPLLGWSQDRVVRFLDQNNLSRRAADGRVYTTPRAIGEFSAEVLASLEDKWVATSSTRRFSPDDFSDIDGAA